MYFPHTYVAGSLRFTQWGFPIRTSPDHRSLSTYPRLIAATPRPSSPFGVKASTIRPYLTCMTNHIIPTTIRKDSCGNSFLVAENVDSYALRFQFQDLRLIYTLFNYQAAISQPDRSHRTPLETTLVFSKGLRSYEKKKKPLSERPSETEGSKNYKARSRFLICNRVLIPRAIIDKGKLVSTPS